MKKLSLYTFTFLVLNSLSQNYCDCDSVKEKKLFTDFCAEYLNINLKSVKKTEAKFKTFVYYYQGGKSFLAPVLHLFKGDKLFKDGIEINSSEEITLLDGLYEVYDKKGRMYNQYLFERGFAKKTVSTYDTKFHDKNKGVALNSIFEFDYSCKPFKVHRIDFNPDGTIYSNVFQTPEKILWHNTNTIEVMTANPFDFKGIPDCN